jgi:hypothetical protein
MGNDLDFHLERGNILADRILHAVDKEIVTLGVTAKAVAGMKPTVAPGRDSGCVVPEVARIKGPRRVAAYDQLADLATADLAVKAIDDSQFIAMKNGCASRSSATWRYRHATIGAGSQPAR